MWLWSQLHFLWPLLFPNFLSSLWATFCFLIVLLLFLLIIKLFYLFIYEMYVCISVRLYIAWGGRCTRSRMHLWKPEKTSGLHELEFQAVGNFMMRVLRTKLLSLWRGANALNPCAVSPVIFKKQCKPGLINPVWKPYVVDTAGAWILWRLSDLGVSIFTCWAILRVLDLCIRCLIAFP